MTYVVAGTVKRDGKLVRGAGTVEVDGTLDAFSRDLRALDALPAECLGRRGKHAAEAWPLDSAEGTKLALAAGLVVKADEISSALFGSAVN